ncbi:MAG: CRISPR-associated endonuclease Cas1 [Anaerolineae bacterium]|nr:CRISPR-associated endonuclease Cas1 [Anaerolineae bacterium]
MPIVEHLSAETYGAFVGKHSERLTVTGDGAELAEAPLLFLETVTLSGRGVSISSDALEACCERGIPVFFLSNHGDPYASIYAPGLTGTVLTRREQLAAFGDWRGASLGLAFARGKVLNQAAFLRYLARNRPDAAQAAELRQAAEAVSGHTERLDGLAGLMLDEARGPLLAAEGSAAQAYWAALGALVPASYAWPGREGRGATDPVNQILNYGYGILYHRIEQAIMVAGLDPYGGFIHTDRPGKPSLTLDLIEEFRAPVVDRAVFGLVNRGFSVERDEAGWLSAGTRRRLAERVLEGLDGEVTHQGMKMALKQVIHVQARAIAAFVRGHSPDYVPFLHAP